jgi:multidrug efflux pump subunit AcrA (membrane-fusion protein)
MRVGTVDANSHVVLKPVELGHDYGSDVEIVRGLDANDKIILSPPDSLTEGTTVRVAPPAKPGRVAKS